MKKSTLLTIAFSAAIAAALNIAADDVSATKTVTTVTTKSSTIKEINKLAPRALVVLDKDCPYMVQPYELTSNFAALINFGVKETVAKVAGQIGSLFGAKQALAQSSEDIPDSLRLAAKQLNWLPMEAEVMYGQRSHEQETNILDRDSKLGKRYYPVADAMLQNLLVTITEPNEYNFKLFILKDSGDNAVARAGGYVYVQQGLIENEKLHQKAYFALAHEIAHVLQRHETQEVQSVVIDSFTAKDDLLKALPKIKDNPIAILDHVKFDKDTYTQHHIDQELQADSCAARLLSRTYPDRQELGGILDAFLKSLPEATATPEAPPPKNDGEKLAALTHDIVTTPLARHPNSKERTDNLQGIYREIVAPPQ